MENITQKEWIDKLSKDDNAIILDVRTPEEWKEGMIANARGLDFFDEANFFAELEKADKSKNYYIYCKSGQRSAMACQILDQMGAKNTYNLITGIKGWSGELEAYES